MNRNFLFILRFISAVLITMLVFVSLPACAPDSGIPSESSPSEPQASLEQEPTDAPVPEESTPKESSLDSSPQTEPETEPETVPPQEPITLKIGSYNIEHGMAVRLKIDKLGQDIKDMELDIVGIQEVDQLSDRSMRIDTMKMLSESSGLPYYSFFKAIDLLGGEYGVAILSKYPIISADKTDLYSGDKEQRVLGHAVIDVNGTNINFFVTHLSAEARELRTYQFAEIAEIVAPLNDFIITGDFNTEVFKDYEPIQNAGMVNNPQYSIDTIPNPNATASIDNIVYSKSNWTFGKPEVLKNGHSDHCMVYATGTFNPN